MPHRAPRNLVPVLIGIAGGSGSGKSWMAARLASLLSGGVVHLSQDDFYLDRSHLTPTRRALLNFDNPRSIDWDAFKTVLTTLRSAKAVFVPQYDFVTHCRRPTLRTAKPAPFIIVDGLWLFLRPRIRQLFTLRVFINCPARVRLEHRLSRDAACRGRTALSIKRQFREMVEPMHRRFVMPQAEHADVVLRGVEGDAAVEQVMRRLRDMSTNLQ